MTRTSNFKRQTKETNIKGRLNLDGSGIRKIDTKIGFFDHMLDLWAFHGGFDLELNCDGDINVCPHHSIEDVGIILGTAFNDAVGNRKGISRYATCFLPMDETLTRTNVDISGRPYHVFNGKFENQSVGAMPTEMVSHFFYSFSMNSKITLHQEILYGSNDHHKIESLFKGLAISLKQGIVIKNDNIPSTKGLL